jgi:hypothetical protein
VARRFPVSERKHVLPALQTLTNGGLCHAFADERFAVSTAGDVILG